MKDEGSTIIQLAKGISIYGTVICNVFVAAYFFIFLQKKAQN